jgi:hypothetical protein
MHTDLYGRVAPVENVRMETRIGQRAPGPHVMTRYQVHVGTTSILHRDLSGLAHDLQGAIERAGYVREPRIASQLLTRRLVMSAYIDTHDAGAAMVIARSVLLTHLYEYGPEFRRVGIHHADAAPIA